MLAEFFKQAIDSEFENGDEVLLRAIFAGSDDLATVLRIHVHVENALNTLIIQTITTEEARIQRGLLLLDAIGFSRKIGIAHQLELYDKAFRNLLDKFNTLRNKFAHKLETRRLKASDDAIFVKAMPPDVRKKFDRWMKLSLADHYDVKKPGFPSRIAMYCLHQTLLDYIIENDAKSGYDVFAAPTVDAASDNGTAEP